MHWNYLINGSGMKKQGLTYDTWNTEFTVLDDYRGLNANMHT